MPVFDVNTCSARVVCLLRWLQLTSFSDSVVGTVSIDSLCSIAIDLYITY